MSKRRTQSKRKTVKSVKRRTSKARTKRRITKRTSKRRGSVKYRGGDATTTDDIFEVLYRELETATEWKHLDDLIKLMERMNTKHNFSRSHFTKWNKLKTDVISKLKTFPPPIPSYKSRHKKRPDRPPPPPPSPPTIPPRHSRPPQYPAPAAPL